MGALKIDYKAMEDQKTAQLADMFQNEIEKRASQFDGGLGSLVLGDVSSGAYDKAKATLLEYVKVKSGDFPQISERLEPYVEHCTDLIATIDSKRSFLKLSGLSAGKQKEIYERVASHFDELKSYLMQIEKIELDFHRRDLQSSVWVVRATSYCLAALFVVAFLKEFVGGIWHSTYIASNEVLNNTTNFLLSLIGL